MSAKDHNKTLAILYAAIGSFYSCGIIAAPWIIEGRNRYRLGDTGIWIGLSDRASLLVICNLRAPAQAYR